MSTTNSFETFNSAFESPFAGNTEENTSNPFATEEEATPTADTPEVVPAAEGEKKKRGPKPKVLDENGEEIIRIISARKANQKERIFYEQH